MGNSCGDPVKADIGDIVWTVTFSMHNLVTLAPLTENLWPELVDFDDYSGVLSVSGCGVIHDNVTGEHVLSIDLLVAVIVEDLCNLFG